MQKVAMALLVLLFAGCFNTLDDAGIDASADAAASDSDDAAVAPDAGTGTPLDAAALTQ